MILSATTLRWRRAFLSELVASQMLLMDTVEPYSRGDEMAADQVKSLYQLVQSTKAAKAQELLDTLFLRFWCDGFTLKSITSDRGSAYQGLRQGPMRLP